MLTPPADMPNDVADDIEQIQKISERRHTCRQATYLDMLNRPMIIEIARTLGYDYTVEWLRQDANCILYLQWIQTLCVIQ